MRRFNPEKELRKIQHGNRDKILYVIILLLLVISIGSTYALYQVRYSKRIIYTKVAPFSNYDLDLAVYVDNDKVNEFPENVGTEYILDYIDCETKGITKATWDIEENGLSVLTKGPNKCNIYFSKKIEQEFLYNGEVETFVVPKAGYYKLEVWGGAGAPNGNVGGQGGYSYGNIKLNQDERIYVVVGGSGSSGGYNGGSNNGGGGATHISKAEGLLQDLSQNIPSILLVAGGGGPGGCANTCAAGSAGGGLTSPTTASINGQRVSEVPPNPIIYFQLHSTGASQTAGGQCITSGQGETVIGRGTFGKGGGTGGGGYYGGCGNVVGSGGSGYLSPDLHDSNTQIGGRSGDGMAKISYVGNNF